MIRYFRQLKRSQVAWIVIALFLLGFALFNVVAYNQAYAMLNFRDSGQRTVKPEALSIWDKVKILLTGITIPKPANEETPDDLDLAFETHTFAGYDGQSLEAWYLPQTEVSKGHVLMFHGYAAAKSAILPEAAAFYEQGYSVFLVDFQGSGGSAGMATSVGFYEAEDVAKSVAYVQTIAPDQPIILYGQSMGGAAILRAVAVEGVEAEAVIIEAVFDRMVSTVANRFTSMGLPPFPAAHTLIFWGGQQRGFSGFQHNPADYAPAVQIPTLVLHGSDDPRVTLDQAENLFDHLPSPKQFKVFEAAGHESYLQTNNRQWNEVVSTFLEIHLQK
ncbi:MAG: alpha/beta fold hydrolase [Chloroflexota bacterium]